MLTTVVRHASVTEMTLSPVNLNIWHVNMFLHSVRKYWINGHVLYWQNNKLSEKSFFHFYDLITLPFSFVYPRKKVHVFQI